MNPAIGLHSKYLRGARAGTPTLPVKGGQRDASPAQPFVSDWLASLHAHHDLGAFLDLADLAQLDVVREPGHQRWAEADAAQIAGLEPREEEKEHASEQDGSDSHAKRGKTQRAVEFAFCLTECESGRNGSGNATTQFQPDERSDSGQKEKEKQREEQRIDGENRSGQNRRKRQHAEKQRVAIRRSAVKPDQHGNDQEMHHRQQQGEKRRIRRAPDEEARQKQRVQREECEVRQQAPRRNAMREFGRASMPPAVTFQQRR